MTELSRQFVPKKSPWQTQRPTLLQIPWPLQVDAVAQTGKVRMIKKCQQVVQLRPKKFGEHRQRLGFEEQIKFCSIAHAAEQPSPLTVFPSSHDSTPRTRPSPQTGLQKDVEDADPVIVGAQVHPTFRVKLEVHDVLQQNTWRCSHPHYSNFDHRKSRRQR